MAAAPKHKAAPNNREDRQAAAGRPVGVSTFANLAPVLLENGYAPLPIQSGSKKPAVRGWLGATVNGTTVRLWSRTHAGCGVGLRTGTLVGVDVDLLDPDLAHQVDTLVRTRLGDTLSRVGRSPKLMLLYRAEVPFRRIAVRGVEVLAQGQQFVAFGNHPDTGEPYRWSSGETPLEVPLRDLPLVDVAACQAMLVEVAALLPEKPRINAERAISVGPEIRNDTLWRRCMAQAHYCDDLDALFDVARTANASYRPLLSDAEVIKTARSAWEYTVRGENWFGRQHLRISLELADQLLKAGPDAYALYTVLRLEKRAGRDFGVANAMAERMPDGPWSRKRFAAARKHLENLGTIVEIHPPNSYYGPALYRWGK